MGTQDAVADRALKQIAKLWGAEGDRVRWRQPDEDDAPGFDWWPGDFRVRVRAVLPETARPTLLKLSVRTDFLKDVASGTDRFAETAALMSKVASSYAWIYSPRERQATSRVTGSGLRRWTSKLFGEPRVAGEASGSLWFESSAYVWSEDSLGWVSEFLGKNAVFQAINAQIQATVFPGMLGGGGPDMTRPAALRDSGLHEILDAIAQFYAPAGEQPSRWVGTGEFEEFAAKWGTSEDCVGFGDAASLGLQTPFGNEAALIGLTTDHKHPQLGHGLMALLQVPVRGTLVSMARMAADLNFLEASAWTGFPLLGGWAVEPGANLADEASLAFGLFMPNGLYQRGLATYIAFWFLDRARWAREQRFPELPDGTMSDIIERQYGHLMKEP